MHLCEVQNVCRRYGSNGNGVAALRGVTLAVRPGEFLALAGPSGSGKTTLLNILGLLDRPDEGRVFFEGADVSTLGERQRTFLRRERIGFIFQNYNLIPVLTAYENVEYFLLRQNLPSAEIGQRAMEVFRIVGLSERARLRANALSGGERQRVAIARALVRDTRLILADEPTAALDQQNGREIIGLMKQLNRERGVTFVFSSHDPAILEEADRVVALADGRLRA
jgi:putative ABC transport system ATP-binding protein